MPAPIVVRSDSWTDHATAWGTIGTAVVAFLALLVTVWLSIWQRVYHRRDLLRQERVPQLMEIAEQYARYLNAEANHQEFVRREAERSLEVQLALLPEGMGRHMKLKFSPESLTPKDRELGKLPAEATQEQPSQQKLIAELRDNIDSARRSGKPRMPWCKRVRSRSWWKAKLSSGMRKLRDCFKSG